MVALSKYVFIRNAATHQEQMGGIPRYGRHYTAGSDKSFESKQLSKITTFADVLVPLFHSHADLLHRDYGFISRCGSCIQADEARPDDLIHIYSLRQMVGGHNIGMHINLAVY